MTKKLWGGRFTKKIDKDFEEFSKSIHYDYKLAEYDITHSIIHTVALQNAGILTIDEAKKIVEELENLKQLANKQEIKSEEAEDIHTEIQNRIERKYPELALKLHSLRSRNDQIVFDEKKYCKVKVLNILKSLLELVGESLMNVVKMNKNKKFIGYTHTQRAQVILFSDYLSAFGYMFLRDAERLKNFYAGIIPYVGAGALTGSSLTKGNYNEGVKEFLNFAKVEAEPYEIAKNGLDNVSDRDFIIEFLSVLSIIQMHLSRLAEDLILYSTKEFNLIELPEEFCTGSSLMPHKKNPDFLELVRGYTGRIYGNLISVLTTMKGLPLTYNRDMQLDKEPLFSSVEIIENELKIMAKFIKGIKLNKEAIEKVLEDKTLYATELAEWLVIEKKVPFQNAHNIAGKVTLLIEKSKNNLEKIDENELKKLDSSLSIEVLKKIMNPEYAIKSKKTISRRLPKIKGINK